MMTAGDTFFEKGPKENVCVNSQVKGPQPDDTLDSCIYCRPTGQPLLGESLRLWDRDTRKCN